MDAAPPVRILKADHGDVRDIRMRGQGRLDFADEDIGPARHDHVGPAIDDVEKALFIQPAEIADRDPPARQFSHPGVAEIAEGRSAIGLAEIEFADLAGQKRLAVFADDAALDADRLAYAS